MGRFRKAPERRITVDMTMGKLLSRRHVSQEDQKSTMSLESFEQFRHLVLRDLALQEQLRVATDRRSFVDLVVQVGGERGCYFTPEDVEAAMRASRQLWIERWI